ncbi:fimbrillin family protein [Parabacteroides sp.]
MKLQGIYLLLVPALLSVSSCSDSDHSEPEQVPIELHASGEEVVVTKADPAEVKEAFSTTVFATRRAGVYTGLTTTDTNNEWMKDADVAVGGTVSLPDALFYPKYGEWIYLVAVAPKIEASSSSYNSADGTVTYTLDGKTDLLYAKQIQGNRWEGSRFSNTDNTKDKPLVYTHLLTQLKFKAKKVTDGLTVKVKKITVSNVNTSVTFPLASGEATFSTSGSLSLSFGDDGAEVSGTLSATDLDGVLLLPPLAAGTSAYQLTVETSVGTFENLPINFGNDGNANTLKQGVSHDITLEISDRELEILSVTVAEWAPVPQDGELDLVN